MRAERHVLCLNLPFIALELHDCTPHCAIPFPVTGQEDRLQKNCPITSLTLQWCKISVHKLFIHCKSKLTLETWWGLRSQNPLFLTSDPGQTTWMQRSRSRGASSACVCRSRSKWSSWENEFEGIKSIPLTFCGRNCLVLLEFYYIYKLYLLHPAVQVTMQCHQSTH